MSEANLRVLADYRLEQADESLRASTVLLAEGLYRPAVNRAYYAMFYAVLSLLAIRRTETSKHGAAISLFDRDFVKSGLLDRKLSRWIHDAFDLRQKADYGQKFAVGSEDAGTVLGWAKEFVSAIKAQVGRELAQG